MFIAALYSERQKRKRKNVSKKLRTQPRELDHIDSGSDGHTSGKAINFGEPRAYQWYKSKMWGNCWVGQWLAVAALPGSRARASSPRGTWEAWLGEVFARLEFRLWWDFRHGELIQYHSGNLVSTFWLDDLHVKLPFAKASREGNKRERRQQFWERGGIQDGRQSWDKREQNEVRGKQQFHVAYFDSTWLNAP